MAGINIVKPGIGQQCIPVGSLILGNLNEVCKADKITLPKKDRIGTGKTLYSYVPAYNNVDQSDRAVNFLQGSASTIFYTNKSSFAQFSANIPDLYKNNNLRLIPEKYLYVKEEESQNIKESVISARNLPCTLTKVVHSNTLTSDPESSCNDNTIVQYGDSEVVSKKTAYYIYPQITATPLSGVYDYHPLLFIPQKQGDAIQPWSTKGNSGSVGIYYKQVSEEDKFLVRPSIRYSLELSWANSADSIEDLWPSRASNFNIFKKVATANPLGKSNISSNTYIRYKSEYGSTYLDTLSPTSKYSDNLKKIQGIAIYNNYTNINSGAFSKFERLQEVLFANSDATYEDRGLKYGLQHIGNKAFYWDFNLSTIKTFFHDTDSVSLALPDSVNSIGIAAFYYTSLDTLTLCNTQITNIPTDCFYDNNFTKLTISDSKNNPSTGELLISSNTKLGSAALRSNTNLTTI